MFDVGFTEILLIGIVALVVIGPERLPAVAKTTGQWIGKLQRFVRGVKTDLASELESGDLKKLIGDQREQINELKNMVNTAKKDFESSTRDVVKGAKKSLGEMETSVKELDADASTGNGNSSVGPENSTISASELSPVGDAAASKDEFARMSSPVDTAANGGTSGETDSSSKSGTNTVEPVSKPDAPTDGSHAETTSSIPSDNSGGQQTPTLRSETPSPKDDSANTNRTGAESGS